MELFCTHCQGIGPHHGVMGKSHGFSRIAVGTWVLILIYDGDGPSKLLFVQRCQDTCLVARDTSGFSSRLGKSTHTPLELKWDTQGPSSVALAILGFLSIFKGSQSSSPFEALNSAGLSSCQSHVRPPVEMRRGPRAFPMLPTRDSDIPSSCKMKDEPAVKPLQGNTVFFRVRASCCPFHLRQHTQGPSSIHLAERSLLLTCLWKVCFPFESKPGNQLSSRDDLPYTELSSSCCAELRVLNLRPCSGRVWSYLNEASNLSCLIENAELLCSQCQGIRPHIKLIWGTRSSFLLLPRLQGPSNLVTGFLGTL